MGKNRSRRIDRDGDEWEKRWGRIEVGEEIEMEKSRSRRSDRDGVE